MSEAGPSAERDRSQEAELYALASWVGAAFAAHYEPQNGNARATVKSLLAREKKYHFFESRGQMTLDDQSVATVAFFALKCLRAMTPGTPSLAEALALAHTNAEAPSGAIAAWAQLDPDLFSDGRIPKLLLNEEWVDPRVFLNPEGADLVPDRTKRDVDDPLLRSYFELWRNAEVYGLDVASRNQSLVSLERFNPALLSAARASLGARTIAVDAFEAAYFIHVEREIRRAQFPFGFELDKNRDAMVLAISLAVESETRGRLDPTPHAVSYLDEPESDGRRLLAPAELFDAFRNTVARISQAVSLRVRPARAFDLVRVAATVQSTAELHHDLPPVLANGWVPVLQREGFGVSARAASSKQQPESDNSRFNSIYARDLLRLVPYTPEGAAAIAVMSPAGSAGRLQFVSQNVELGDFKGVPRTDAIVGRTRAEILDGFYRARMGHDQRGQSEDLDLNSVNSVLNYLLGKRIRDTYTAANKRPVETTFDDDSDEQGLGLKAGRVALRHDQMLADRRREAEFEQALTRDEVQEYEKRRSATADELPAPVSDSVEKSAQKSKPRFGVGVYDWVDDFLEVIPVLAEGFRSFQRWSEKHGALTPPDDIEHLRQLDGFARWVKVERNGNETGRERPATVQAAKLAPIEQLSLAAATKAWADSLPGRQASRNHARRGIELAINRICESEMWRALALGISLEEIEADSKVDLEDTIKALRRKNALRKLLPTFLIELMDSDIDLGVIFDERDLVDPNDLDY